MKTILIALVMLLVCLSATAFADQYVRGYFRQNGTYVQPYWRTTPNSNLYDNYSTKGNVNPYTGQRGYENPYKYPSYNPPSINPPSIFDRRDNDSLFDNED